MPGIEGFGVTVDSQAQHTRVIVGSPITFRNFCSRHGPALMGLDVMRKPSGLRSPAIFNAERFDGAAFELMTNRSTNAPQYRVEETKQC